MKYTDTFLYAGFTEGHTSGKGKKMPLKFRLTNDKVRYMKLLDSRGVEKTKFWKLPSPLSKEDAIRYVMNTYTLTKEEIHILHKTIKNITGATPVKND